MKANKTFVVIIEEIAVQEFEVFANNAKEAKEIVEKQYKNGTIVLSPGEVHSRQIAIVNPEQEIMEWSEF